MGLLEWLKKKQPWQLDAPKEEEFLIDQLDNYSDPLLMFKLNVARELVLPACEKHVVIGGGFAAHFAGITNTHDDIDLFCLTPLIYEWMKDFITSSTDGRFTDVHFSEGLSYNAHKAILWFKYEGYQFNLIDAQTLGNLVVSKKVRGPNKFLKSLDSLFHDPKIIDLLMGFDLNWSMVGIDLFANSVVCHISAFADKPLVNTSRELMSAENTVKRMEKYRLRLVRSPDMKACRKFAEALMYEELKKGD